MVNLRFKGPAAYVSDLERARAFYEGLLGLTVHRVMRRGDVDIAVSYETGISIWLVDDAYWSIFGETAGTPGTLAGGNWENTFETPTFGDLYERLTQAGARFAHPLQELPWGQRGFRVYDPDGHIIDISETHGALVRRLFEAGVTKAAIAQQVSLTESQIDAYLASED
jgi:catechol 2,3-dioxygenase-like lactoylglutathione lyase family enzyme